MSGNGINTGEPFAPGSPITRDVSVPPGTSPAFRDYPRLVFNAPYFTQGALADMFGPAVYEAGLIVVPQILQSTTLLADAVATAVQGLAVQRSGDTMSGPLFMTDPIPTMDHEVATKLYVDMVLASEGIPEVPLFPPAQLYLRALGVWIPYTEGGGDGAFLHVTGGPMLGAINMMGNTIDNLAPLPVLPNGAAPAAWVLQQIAAMSLFQGAWEATTNTPNLSLPANQQDRFSWIALTADPAIPEIVPPTPAMPGLNGAIIDNGDTIIWSAVQGQYLIVKGGTGGLTLSQAQGLFLALAGGTMGGTIAMAGHAISDVVIDDGEYV